MVASDREGTTVDDAGRSKEGQQLSKQATEEAEKPNHKHKTPPGNTPHPRGVNEGGEKGRGTSDDETPLGPR